MRLTPLVVAGGLWCGRLTSRQVKGSAALPARRAELGRRDERE